MDAGLDALLRLTLAEGMGPVRVHRLLDRFGSARSVLETSADRLSELRGFGRVLADQIERARRIRTDRLWRRAAAVGAGAISSIDAGYPVLLSKIFDPPPLLWVRPHPAGLAVLGDRPCVAVVGTRKATPYGRRMARRIGADLASRGVTVVSGMAYGIDAEAHEGALEAGGPTVAVLGCGVDRIYPAAHADLAARIMQTGALVSEFAPGTRPDAGHFPRRNRLIAGMGISTVIVEANDRGGALITARLALQENRTVYAVPGPLDSPASRGVNRLLLDTAAYPLVDVDQIAETLLPGLTPVRSESVSLTAEEKTVYDAMSPMPVHLDDLLETTGLHVSRLLATLLTLEIKSLVRQLAGQHFCRVGADAR